MEVAAAAADHHPVTHEQLRDFAAVQDEKHREHDANYSQLQGAMDTNTKNKKREFVSSAVTFLGTPRRVALGARAGLCAARVRILQLFLENETLFHYVVRPY